MDPRNLFPSLDDSSHTPPATPTAQNTPGGSSATSQQPSSSKRAKTSSAWEFFTKQPMEIDGVIQERAVCPLCAKTIRLNRRVEPATY